MSVTSLEEIATRAEAGWPIGEVPYSQSVVWNDDDGRSDEDGYRRDCSGFASMAMGLARPGLSTVTLVNVCHQIPWQEMRRGDLVMLGGPGTAGDAGHVGVVVAVHAPTYEMLEQSGGLGPDRNTYRIGAASRSDMVPYRSAYVTVPQEEEDLVKGLIVQDANSIVRVFDHPVLGTPVYVNIGSGHVVEHWKRLGWQFYDCAPGETIHTFGQDLATVNRAYLESLRAGSSAEVKVTSAPITLTGKIGE